MLESIFSIFQSFFANPQFFVPTVWVALGCTIAWFVLSAKHTKKLTEKEVNILWKSHKQFNQCNADTFTEIKKGKQSEKQQQDNEGIHPALHGGRDCRGRRTLFVLFVLLWSCHK